MRTLTAREQALVDMSRAVLDAADSCAATLRVVNAALLAGSDRGIPTFGFNQLMAVRGPLAAVAAGNGAAVELATNELRALGVSR